jgi:hypothetical protein
MYSRKFKILVDGYFGFSLLSPRVKSPRITIIANIAKYTHIQYSPCKAKKAPNAVRVGAAAKRIYFIMVFLKEFNIQILNIQVRGN